MDLLDKVKKLEQEHRKSYGEKRARHYADEYMYIIDLKTKAERRSALKAALDEVPEEYRRDVEFYIRDAYARKYKTKLPDYKVKP